MNQEIAELHLVALLTKETLQDRRLIGDGQQRLNDLRELLARYESSIKQKAEELPAKIEAAEMEASQKRAFIRGFNATKGEGLNDISEYFELEREVADKLDEILSFMQGRSGRYHFVGRQISFDSASDARAYNRHIAELNDINRREDERRLRVQKKSLDKVAHLQKLLR